MKKLLAMVLALSLMLGLIPAMAAAEDDWVTLRVEMYDRSTAGFNVEDCWQLHYIQDNFGDPNHIKVGFPCPAGKRAKSSAATWPVTKLPTCA